MKFTGREVFAIMGSLSAANSTKGQGRKFIRINKNRFSEAYGEIVGWAGDFEDDFDGITVQKAPDNTVVSFQLDPENGKEALEAFSKFLSDTDYEIEPYRMTEGVLDFIDGIDINQEGALMQLTTEAV